MPRPQFTLRSLLVAMLVVAAFFGGIQFERERRRQEDEAALMIWAGSVWNRGEPDEYVTGTCFVNQPIEHAETE